jgi:carbonic anhydrase
MTEQCTCNLSRRQFISATAMGSVALFFGGFDKAFASSAKSNLTPDEALEKLKEGNARFVSGKTKRPHLTKDWLLKTYKEGQHPFATIIGCSDSRVPVEELFDQGVGDIFTIRVAGNVVHTDEAGSAEYGAGHLGTPVIVVLGHTKCGAVTAVAKGDKLGGSIPKLVDTIAPAVERSKAKGLTGDELINDAIVENVKESMSLLLKNSQEISHLVHEGKVKLVGALYHLENGNVEWL